MPARTPHSRTGYGTPSAWMNTIPGTSASGSSAGRLRRAPRRRVAVTASSVPAVATHTNRVETAATTHDATKVAQSGDSVSSGQVARTTQMIKVWLKSPISTAPTQPSSDAMATSTGRSTAPMTKIRMAVTSACGEARDVEVRHDPGRDHEPECCSEEAEDGPPQVTPPQGPSPGRLARARHGPSMAGRRRLAAPPIRVTGTRRSLAGGAHEREHTKGRNGSTLTPRSPGRSGRRRAVSP